MVYIYDRLIRLSSPKLNNITVFGVIILYLAMVIFAIPTQSKSVVHGLCIARLWFLSLGVSLAFGTIIMKMFRVYIIFCKTSPKRKKVSGLTCDSIILLSSRFRSSRKFYSGWRGRGTFTYSACCKPLILILCFFR